MEAKEVCEVVEVDDRLVTCEIEAAEALAGLARNSAVRCGCGSSVPSDCLSQDQAIAVQQYCRSTPSMVTCALVAEETVRVAPSQLWSTVKSASKMRQNLFEAEKEARRVHRVSVNRESARQTIRRRQEMLLELTHKVASLSEENKNLKKEKEIAVKEYESLKRRNIFLKLQMANKTNVEPRETQEEVKSSGAELACSATMGTSSHLYSQPSLVPFFWPSAVPYPNAFQLRCAAHPDVISSSQFLMQQKDLPPSHQGKDICLGNIGQGNALFVLPVPWLLPVLRHSNALNSHSDANRASKETISVHQCSPSSPSDMLFAKDNYRSSTNPSMRVEAFNSSRAIPAGGPHGICCAFPEDNDDRSTGNHLKHNLLPTETFCCLRPVEGPRPIRHPQTEEIRSLKNVSTPEHISHTLLRKNNETLIFRQKKSENAYAALKARRRRKELMRIKNINYRHFHMHSAGD